MAKIGDIKISVDAFLTNTRVRICCNLQCKYLHPTTLSCGFKTIKIEENGKCSEYEENPE